MIFSPFQLLYISIPNFLFHPFQIISLSLLIPFLCYIATIFSFTYLIIISFNIFIMTSLSHCLLNLTSGSSLWQVFVLLLLLQYIPYTLLFLCKSHFLLL